MQCRTRVPVFLSVAAVLAGCASQQAAAPGAATGFVTSALPSAASEQPVWSYEIAYTPAASNPQAQYAPPGSIRPAALIPRSHALDGIASYYWQDQMTASGQRFDKRAMTAAHKTLPLGTKVRVTHLGNGRSVDVLINDRGPYKHGRVIDLSEAAAEKLNMTAQGLAAVKVEVIKN